VIDYNRGADVSTLNSTIVFTDGAAKGNPGPGGWGAIVVRPDGQVTELGGGAAHTTNNRMELSGAIGALGHLQGLEGPIAVYTDSTYVIKGIREWIWAWRRRGWKTAEGNDVLNRELWEALSQLVSARDKSDITWHYVRGHVGTPGNERCDVIAVAFSHGRPPELYDGPLITYPLEILDLPDDTDVPERSSASSSKSKAKTPAYSYLSLVDGTLVRHTTWADCERRVKGKSGAKFKKAASAGDEAVILREWGQTRG
jgi:ribonuclease HI